MLAAAIVATAIFSFGAVKVGEWSAAPEKEKDCLLRDPGLPETGKPVELTVPMPDSFAFVQSGGYLNDASCLNRTPIYGVVAPKNEDEIRQTLRFASENHLPVAMAGAHHSMGGQSIAQNGIVLDMNDFDEIVVNQEGMTMRVQSGATWGEIQQQLDPLGLSVKAMQSINIFSVGGTLSVNAHGIAHDPGQVAPTVRSMRIMLADGSVVTASREQNEELFRHVLGGYGLFGVILDADLDVVQNEVYGREDVYVDYKDFSEYFTTYIDGNPRDGLFYARLSVAPQSYLREVAVHQYARTKPDEDPQPLHPETHNGFLRFVVNFSKTGSLGRWTRWMLEKYLQPFVFPSVISRNQAMFDSMTYLKNNLNDTDILQEYFVPHDQFAAFVDGLRETVRKNDANLLNATIRIVHADQDTAMPYAPEGRFAVVLYFNVSLDESKYQDQLAALDKTTNELIDLSTSLRGSFYLPYRLTYSSEQLRMAYPATDAFFETKQTYDPAGLFQNAFSNTYGPR